MQTINRQALAERIHANAVAKGFWPTTEDDKHEYSPEHYAMLVIAELSEAVEAHRNGRWASKEKYENTPKTWTPADAFNSALFESCIKDSVEDELADAYIRLLDMWGAYFKDERLCILVEAISPAPICSNRTFTEDIYLQCCLLSFREREDLGNYHKIGGNIVAGLAYLEAICTKYNIDLAWHIEEKMRYNESRPPLHGKEY